MPRLKRQYINTGLVRFIHKDLPLSFHPQAKPAAAAKKLAVEMMGGLLQALPVQLLDQSSLQQAAQALLARAADGAVDATARADPNPNRNRNRSPNPNPSPSPEPEPEP